MWKTKDLATFNFTVMGKKGKLYLIPAPLGDDGVASIPAYVIEHLHRIDIFIAERAKTARRFIKRTQPTKPFDALTFYEENGEVCPANWTKGKDGLTATHDGIAEFLSK